MASSSLSVVGSGLDIPTLVSQLVANERKPAADRINIQGSTVTAKLSALGSIKSSLSSMQSALDALVKGEQPTALQVVGAVLVMGGLVLSQKAAGKPGNKSTRHVRNAIAQD